MAGELKIQKQLLNIKIATLVEEIGETNIKNI